jgi:hypothetical protein
LLPFLIERERPIRGIVKQVMARRLLSRADSLKDPDIFEISL